jgi:hypothetical protein
MESLRVLVKYLQSSKGNGKQITSFYKIKKCFQNNKRRAGGCNGRSIDGLEQCKTPPVKRPSQNDEKKKRPFQKVEKICSIAMAILFICFNIVYWPWLLSDDDFDYAKFEVSILINLFALFLEFSFLYVSLNFFRIIILHSFLYIFKALHFLRNNSSVDKGVWVQWITYPP